MKNTNEELPDSAYLYVKDGVKKLPYRTASGELDWDRIPLAVAAVTVGYRGQVVDLPIEERKRIARKLLRIYKENDKEPPESLLKFLGMDENSVVKIQDRNQVEVLSVEEKQEEENSVKKAKCILHHVGKTANGVYYSDRVLKENFKKWENVRCYNGHNFNRQIEDLVGVFTNIEYDDKNGAIIGTLNVVPRYNWLFDVDNVLKIAGQNLSLSSVIDIDAQYDYNSECFNVININSVESVDVVTEGATQSRFLEVNSKNGNLIYLEEEQQEMSTNNVQEIRDENKNTINVNAVDFNQVVKIANRNTMLSLFNNYNYPEFVKEQVAKYVDSNSSILEYSVIEEFANKINAEFVKSVQEYAKNYEYSGFAKVESEPADNIKLAFLGFLYDKDMKDSNDRYVPRYKSIRQFYEDLTGDRYITGRLENVTNKRLFANFCGKDINSITTEDFANVLSNLLNRRLLDEYNMQNLELGSWRNFVDVVPVRDFRPQIRLRFGGYGDLPKVAQGANYENLTELTDESATYAVEKRGGTEDLTLEAIANDDVMFVRRIPVKLARAAARTLHKFVYNTLIFDNPTIYDNVTLFSTTRTVPTQSGNVTVVNRGTKPSGAAYNITHIRDARVAMSKFPELNSGERLGIVPRYVLVPLDLADLFFGILNAERYPRLTGTANTENFPPNDANWARRWGLDILVNVYASATDSVVFVADKADVPTIEIGFFGSEEPEIIVQDRPDVGSMFAADKITFKIRHIYGGAVLDFRAFYGFV